MSSDNEKAPLVTVPGFKKDDSIQSIQSTDAKSRLPDGKTSIIGAAFIVSNAALGAGMLSVPYAFWTTGGPLAGLLVEIVRFYCIGLSWARINMVHTVHRHLNGRPRGRGSGSWPWDFCVETRCTSCSFTYPN